MLSATMDVKTKTVERVSLTLRLFSFIEASPLFLWYTYAPRYQEVLYQRFEGE